MTAKRIVDVKREDEIRKGIAAYAHEQRVLLRLLRKRSSFTENEFDRWFRSREWKRPLRPRGITGDAFILGMGVNGGNEWAKYLDLIQHMMRLGLIAAKTINGVVTYFPGQIAVTTH